MYDKKNVDFLSLGCKSELKYHFECYLHVYASKHISLCCLCIDFWHIYLKHVEPKTDPLRRIKMTVALMTMLAIPRFISVDQYSCSSKA